MLDALAAAEHVDFERRGAPLRPLRIAGSDHNMAGAGGNEPLDLADLVGVVIDEQPLLNGLTAAQGLNDYRCQLRDSDPCGGDRLVSPLDLCSQLSESRVDE